MARRTNSLGIRVMPEIKAALEKAAADDDRTVSAMAERILRQWLQAKGYLPEERSPPS